MRARFLRPALVATVLLGLAVPASWAKAPAKDGHRVRLLKTWQDAVKVDGGADLPLKVELYFDYTEGLARKLVYDDKGKLLESKAIMVGQPRPSDEEIAEAIAIVRADRFLGRVVARSKAVPEGGFGLEEGEGQACGPRTRCVHVLWLSPDRRGLVRWVVVDLVKQAIAYRAYTPPDGAALQEVTK